MNKLEFTYTVWTIMQPVAAVLLSMLAAVVAARLNAWLGLKNEAQLRDALHKSAENAVAYASSMKGLSVSAAMQEGISRQLVSTAAQYVKEKNPVALKKLGVNEKMLNDIVQSKFAIGSR